MSTEATNECVLSSGPNLADPDDARYEAAVSEIINRLARSWRIPETQVAPALITEGWFPPSRPRRGYEDC